MDKAGGRTSKALHAQSSSRDYVKQSLNAKVRMAPPVLRDYLRSSGMGTAAFAMFVATITANACNYIYQIIMGNALGDNFVELSSLLSILYIVSVPANSVQNIMTRYVSKYKAKGMEKEISWLIRRTLLLIIAAGIGLFIAILAISPLIRDFLSLGSGLPIFIIALAAALALIVPVGAGPLQGLQRFYLLGAQSVAGAVTKLLMAVLLVALGFGVAGAVGGAAMGLAVSAVISFTPIRSYLSEKGTRVDIGEVWRYTIPSTIAVLCFTVITQVDVIFAAHYLPKDLASAYSAASMLGKIILFLPGAIAAVMFPRISDAHAKRKETARILRRSILLTAILSGIVALVYVIAPEFILQLLYGGKFLEAAPSLQIIGVAMFLFSIANLFMIYGLATDGHIYTWILSLFTALELALMMVNHSTPMAIAANLLITGLLVTIVSGAHLELRERAKRKYSPFG